MTGRRVAVIGLGLIGASIGGALRERGDFVRGLDADSEVMRTVLERGAVDEVALDLGTVVEGATVVILAIPVLSIVRILPEVDALAPPEAVILDVGSVKSPVCAAMEQLPGAHRAVGGHPIAGKESSGPLAADTSLFGGRSFALVPTRNTSDGTLEAAQDLVYEIGSRPIVLSASDHDRMVARTSHLPQLLSMALTLSLNVGDGSLAGPGLRDMTRLAASHPRVWSDIFQTNADNIRTAVTVCMEHLQEISHMLAENDTASLQRAMLAGNERSALIAAEAPL